MYYLLAPPGGCVRIPPIPSLPVVPNCTYNVSIESVYFDGSDACSRVLLPGNAQPNSSTPEEITSRSFSRCLEHFNSTVCEMEQLCSISDQLSCRLRICNVAADNHVGQNQTNLDVYTACFTVMIRASRGPPDMPPNMPPNMLPNRPPNMPPNRPPNMPTNMPPNRTLLLVTTASWFEYCLDETNDYEACISFYVEVCFSGDFPGSTSQCLMALPVLCGLFEFDLELQQECASTVEMVLRATVPSMCGRSENVETCVSS